MQELRCASSSRISEPSLVVNGGISFRFLMSIKCLKQSSIQSLRASTAGFNPGGGLAKSFWHNDCFFAKFEMSYPNPYNRCVRIMLLICLAGVSLQAKVVNITTNDSYAKIEAAVAGDEVVIASGTYGFRLYLTHQGTPNNPIVIRALDPAHP